ncbi:hypothetical protein AAHE18_17G077800 [Arachis hypogaea]
MLGALDGVVGRLVGVDALDMDLDEGTVGLLVGVEDLTVDLDKGVEDLAGTVGLVAATVVLEAEIILFVRETTGLVVEDVVLFVATAVLAEDKVAREVGVEDLGFEAVVNVGRPVGEVIDDEGPPSYATR